MALTDLIAALEAEVAEKAAAEIEAGRREAERITLESQQSIARRRAELLAGREAVLRRDLMPEYAEAEASLRVQWMAARERVIRDVLRRAEAALPGLQDRDAYQIALAGEVTDALSYVEPRGVVVRSSRALLARLSRLLDRRSWVTVELDDTIRAGFRVVAEDGRIEVNKTIESRLRRMEPRLRMEIVHRLEAMLDAQADERNAYAMG
jgi:vacuolar-type H+-ATPase subunit E/Vma4